MAHATRILDDTFSREYARDCHLSVLIRSNRISYAVYDPERNKYLGFHASYFAESSENSLHVDLRRLISDEELLHLSFAETKVALAYRPAILIPDKLYDADQPGLNLKMQGLAEPNVDYMHDKLPVFSAVLEYAVEKDIREYLEGVFSRAKLVHATSGLLCGTVKQQEEKRDTVFIHIHREHFSIIVYRGNDLKLVNNFNFHAKEDFIYYVLSCCEETGLDREAAQFVFLGEIVEQSALYEIAYKYLRNITFGKRPAGIRYQREIRSMPSHFNYNLFALQACE